MLKQTNWGHWSDISAYPTEIVVLADETTGVCQWRVFDYPSNTTYASSYAASLEDAYNDAKAAIGQGAVCEIGARAVTCYDTFIVASELAQKSTTFREVTPGVWVGFHAGKRIEVNATDIRKVPHLAAKIVHGAEIARQT